MMVLERLFGHIVYSEVRRMFEILEVLYLVITQDLMLNLSKVATGINVSSERCIYIRGHYEEYLYRYVKNEE